MILRFGDIYMKCKTVLIFVLLISATGFLEAGWSSWFDSAAWKEWFSSFASSEEVKQVSLFGNNSLVNYFHDSNQALDIEKSKSDWAKIVDNKNYASGILYIYSVLQKDKELKLNIFDFYQVQEVFDNQIAPIISVDNFDVQIQGVISDYKKRKAKRALDNSCVSDTNSNLSEIEKEIVKYLIDIKNTVDDGLINLIVSLTILNII